MTTLSSNISQGLRKKNSKKSTRPSLPLQPGAFPNQWAATSFEGRAAVPRGGPSTGRGDSRKAKPHVMTKVPWSRGEVGRDKEEGQSSGQWPLQKSGRRSPDSGRSASPGRWVILNRLSPLGLFLLSFLLPWETDLRTPWYG